MTTLNTSNLNTPNTMASGLPYNTAYINGHSWLHAKIPAIIIFVPPKLLLLGGTDPKIFSLAPLANYFVPPNLKTVAPPLHKGYTPFGKIYIINTNFGDLGLYSPHF